MKQTFDEANSHLRIWVGGELLDRDEAKISVFDSLVQGGDGCWELKSRTPSARPWRPTRCATGFTFA
jgi:hypothetical protein